MKRCLVLLLLLFVVCSYSCAKPLYSVVQHDYFPSSHTDTQTARIVFLRPTEGLLSMYHIGIYDGNALIGILPSLSYFSYNVQPGKHTFGALYFLSTDFVEADVEAGKTYYVFCGIYDAFLGLTHAKMTAIKKESENMPRVSEWLNTLKKAELTDAGIEYYKSRRDEKGTYIIGRQGLIKARLNIDAIRAQWLAKAKRTGKPGLTAEDGVAVTEMLGLRKQVGTAKGNRYKSTGTGTRYGHMSFQFPEAGEPVSIEDIPSGRLSGDQIKDLLSNTIAQGRHTRRGFTFKRYFKSDGSIYQTSPKIGQHSGQWRTKRDGLCIKWKNNTEKCVAVIKEHGRINQYWTKRSGDEVKVTTYDEIASVAND